MKSANGSAGMVSPPASSTETSGGRLESSDGKNDAGSEPRR